MTLQLNAFEISEAELLLDFFRELVNKNEIKTLRKLLKNNPYYTQFKTKDLNKQFKIDGYKFTKRNNNIILIVDKKDTIVVEYIVEIIFSGLYCVDYIV